MLNCSRWIHKAECQASAGQVFSQKVTPSLNDTLSDVCTPIPRAHGKCVDTTEAAVKILQTVIKIAVPSRTTCSLWAWTCLFAQL